MHGHTPIKQGNLRSLPPHTLPSFFQVYIFEDGTFLVEVADKIFKFWPTGEWHMYEYPALSSQIARERKYTVLHGEKAMFALLDYLYR